MLELHALRQDVADECAQLNLSAAGLLSAVDGASRAAGTDARALGEALDAIHAGQANPVALSLGDSRESPLFVSDVTNTGAAGTVSLTEDDRAQLHADAEQQRFALWFLAGLLVVATSAPLIRRVWLP